MAAGPAVVTTRDIEYPADGTTTVGRLALPDGTDRRPAVLIAHDGPGLHELQRHRATRLAELGYVAFALDHHGGGRWIADPQEMRAAGVDWRLNLYGGAEHSFTHPLTDPGQAVLPGIGYHRKSDQRSWRAMLDLFDETFGVPG